MSTVNPKYSREWFRESWKRRIIAWSVIWIIAATAMYFIETNNDASERSAVVNDDISLAYYDGTPRRFVREFKDGRFGRHKADFSYAASFKRTFLNKARDAWYAKYARSTHPTSGYPGDAYIWNDFRNHDTCDSPIINVPDCNWQGNDGLLTGSYWEERRDRQDKWMLRVIYCGGTAVGVLMTGGSAGAAIGNGATFCFAGLYVD